MNTPGAVSWNEVGFSEPKVTYWRVLYVYNLPAPTNAGSSLNHLWNRLVMVRIAPPSTEKYAPAAAANTRNSTKARPWLI